MKRNGSRITSLVVLGAGLCCLLSIASPVRAIEIPLQGAIGGDGKGGLTNIAYADIERLFTTHPMTKRLKADFIAEVEHRRKALSDLENKINETERIIASSSTVLNQMRTDIEVQGNRLEDRAAALSQGTTAQAPLPGMPANTAPAAGQGVSGSTAPAVAGSTATAPSAQQDVLKSTVAAGGQPVTSPLADREKQVKETATSLETLKANLAKMKEELAVKAKNNREELARLEELQTSTVLKDIYQVLESIAKEENISVIFDKSNILYGQDVRDITDMVSERLRGR